MFTRPDHADPDRWRCPCGALSDFEGQFVPVAFNGVFEVDYGDEMWEGEYLCISCGRVALPDSLQVVRRVDLADVVWLTDHDD